MKKLFIYLIIRMTTRHALNAIKIYDTIYNRKQPQKPKKKVVKETQYRQPVISNKKDEVIKSLNYLKSKTVKSKQDKSSISMLEGVLATMQ
tara:strand:+ start:156 stop:428 length:273 start_codon:yes stop_codon:yes gene_type:complete